MSEASNLRVAAAIADPFPPHSSGGRLHLLERRPLDLIEALRLAAGLLELLVHDRSLRDDRLGLVARDICSRFVEPIVQVVDELLDLLPLLQHR